MNLGLFGVRAHDLGYLILTHDWTGLGAIYPDAFNLSAEQGSCIGFTAEMSLYV